MYGRNGFDALSIALLLAALILNCINKVTYALAHVTLLYGLLSLPVYALFFYSLFRVLSHNLPARRAELRKWQTFLTRLKDRENRYFHCPNCKQTVRVPRNRGKLNIRCPKCGERFTRKT